MMLSEQCRSHPIPVNSLRVTQDFVVDNNYQDAVYICLNCFIERQSLLCSICAVCSCLGCLLIVI